MHEAGLARRVAQVLLEHGLRVEQVRLTVHGGHHDPDAFAAELREHLAALLPDSRDAIAALEIRRGAFAHLCVACGEAFETAAIDAACPSCGADSMPTILEEQIDLEELVRQPA